MKNLSTDSEVKMDSVISRLSKEQKTLLLLLKKSNVGEDALIGTFLLLKDNQELMEEMILFYCCPVKLKTA